MVTIEASILAADYARLGEKPARPRPLAMWT